ncbi:MAG: cytochrome c3 family protein [Pseudomonadota bacterium]
MNTKLAATLIVLLTCFSFSFADEEKTGAVFPHVQHVEEQTCTDCHQTRSGSTEPGFPDSAVCAECHDDSPEKRVRSWGAPKTANHIIFSHGIHAKSECRVCHPVMENNPPKIPGYQECRECHAFIGGKTGCRDCHPILFTPKYHQGLWRRFHDEQPDTAAINSIHGRDCGACHPEPSCRRCHQTMKPRSHTGFFRMRGHGLAAAVETTSCRTCHRESFCIQCHRESKPLNHRGAWASTHGFAIPGGYTGSIGKCGVCHQPSWCRACHSR